jgi:hypothetical protein
MNPTCNPNSSVLAADSPVWFMLSTILGFVFAVVWWGSNNVVAISAIVCIFLISGVGLALISIVGGFRKSDQSPFLIAPSVGLISVSAIAQVCFANALPVELLVVGVLITSVAGMLVCRGRLTHALQTRVPLGIPILACCLIVLVLFFLPGALNDSTFNSSGCYRWIYVDSTYHVAVAGVLATNSDEPQNPGVAIWPLHYHFGSHAIAATVSLLTEIHPGDSLVRIVRLLGYLGLIGVGLFAGAQYRGEAYRASWTACVAIVAVFLLSTWTTFLATFSDTSAPAAQGSALYRYASIFMTEPLKAHLLGFSGLWSVLVVGTLCVLLLGKRDPEQNLGVWGARLFAVCAPMSIALNAVAGVQSSAVFVVLVTLCSAPWRLKIPYWLIVISLSLTMLSIGGVWNFQDGDTAELIRPFRTILRDWTGFGLTISKALFSFAVFGTLLLARTRGLFKYVVILWILAAWAMASLLGGDFRTYSEKNAYFLFCLCAGLSIGELWNSPNYKVTDIYRATLSLFYIVAGSLLLASLAGSLLEHDLLGGEIAFAVGIFISAWVVGKMTLHGKYRREMRVVVAATVLVLALAGTVRVVWNYGWNGLKVAVEIDPGRVRSLLKLREISDAQAIVATTHHGNPADPKPYRNYSYGALSGRQMLLEGWRYGEGLYKTEALKRIDLMPPEFRKLYHDNQSIFSTHDSERFRSCLTEYGVSYIILEPGQELGVDALGLSFIEEIHNSGTMRIYRVKL